MRLLFPLVAAAALLLSASCTQNDTGIFAGIESEQKVESLGGLSKYASVFSMAEDTVNQVYYAAGGKALFHRSVSATAWTASTVGGHSEVAAVGQDGSTVWAVAGGKLYKLGSGSWTEDTSITLGTDVVTNLVPVIDTDGISVVGQYVVTKNTAGSYSKVYRLTSGATGAAVNLQAAAATLDSDFTDLGSPITSAVTTGTEDIVASRSLLWDISGTTPTAYRAGGSAPDSEYAGLVYASGKLLLSVASTGTTGGGVYWVAVSANAGALAASFAAVTNGKDLTYSSKPVSPAAMRFISGSNSVWVGTESGSASYEGNGVLEVKNLSGTPTLSVTPSTGLVTSSNYTSTSLYIYKTPVIFQASDNTVFLGTGAHGLWKWDSSAKIFGQQ